MHEGPGGGQPGQTQAPPQRVQGLHPGSLPRGQGALHRQPGPPREGLRHPAPGLLQGGGVLLPGTGGHPEGQAAPAQGLQVGPPGPVAPAAVPLPPLPATSPGTPGAGPGQELAEVPPGLPMGGQEHQPGAVLQGQLGSQHQVQAPLPGRRVGPHRPRHRGLVGEGQGRVAQGRGPLHQLLGEGGPAQEAEAGEGVQLGVGRNPVAWHDLYICTVSRGEARRRM